MSITIPAEWEDTYRNDYAVIAVAMVFFFLLRILNDFIFSRAGRAWNVTEVDKFCESMFKIVVFSPISYWGFSMAFKYGIFPQVETCFDNFTEQTLSDDIRLRYLVGLGWYVYATLTTLFYDASAKSGSLDIPLLAHHIVTFAVMWYSYYNGLFLVGIVILALHDVGEIAVDGSKLTVYLRTHIVIQALGYIMLLSTWFGTRLYVFPLYVIQKTWTAGTQINDESFDNLILGCNACLVFLLLLHVYWFLLILRIGFRILTTGDGANPDTKAKKA